MVDAVSAIQRSFLSPSRPSRPAAAERAPPQPRDAGRITVVGSVADDATEACWRAALIARDHRLRLQLTAACGADSQEHGALQCIATDIRSHLALDVQVELARSTLSAAALHAAAQSALAVLPAPPRQGWPYGGGRMHARIACDTGTPVLAVRQPAQASYRRVLVAAPAGAAAVQVVRTARLFSRDPRMIVAHVLARTEEDVMVLAGVPESVRSREREHAVRRARSGLADKIAAAGAAGDGAEPRILLGDPATELLLAAAAAEAELLVIGVAPRPWWGAWWPRLSLRLLHRCAADVLLVPLSLQGHPMPEAA